MVIVLPILVVAVTPAMILIMVAMMIIIRGETLRMK